MNRNYYPFPPEYMYYTQPCGMRRCMYQHQHIHQGQLPLQTNMNGQPSFESVHVNPIQYSQSPNFAPNPNADPNPNPNPPMNPTSYAQGDSVQSATFTHQFLNESGQLDVNKMLSTVGHLAETVQQVSPVIKQVNDIIQSFRV